MLKDWKSLSPKASHFGRIKGWMVGGLLIVLGLYALGWALLRCFLWRLTRGDPQTLKLLAWSLKTEVKYEILKEGGGRLKLGALNLTSRPSLALRFEGLECTWSVTTGWWGEVKLDRVALQGVEAALGKPQGQSYFGGLSTRARIGLFFLPRMEVRSLSLQGILSVGQAHYNLERAELQSIVLSPISRSLEVGTCILHLSELKEAPAQKRLHRDFESNLQALKEGLGRLQKNPWNFRWSQLQLQLPISASRQSWLEKKGLFLEEIQVVCSRLETQGSLWSLEAEVILEGYGHLRLDGDCDWKGLSRKCLKAEWYPREKEDESWAKCSLESFPQGLTLKGTCKKVGVIQSMLLVSPLDWDWKMCHFEGACSSWEKVQCRFSWEMDDKEILSLKAQASEAAEGWKLGATAESPFPFQGIARFPSSWGQVALRMALQPSLNVQVILPPAKAGASWKPRIEGKLQVGEVVASLTPMTRHLLGPPLSPDEIFLSASLEESLKAMKGPLPWHPKLGPLTLEWLPDARFSFQGSPPAKIEGALRIEGEVTPEKLQVTGTLKGGPGERALASGSPELPLCPLTLEELTLEGRGALDEGLLEVVLGGSNQRRKRSFSIESIRLQGSLKQLQRLQLKFKSEKQFKDLDWEGVGSQLGSEQSSRAMIESLLSDVVSNAMSVFRWTMGLEQVESWMERAFPEVWTPNKVGLVGLAIEDSGWVVELLEIDWGRLVLGGGCTIPFPNLNAPTEAQSESKSNFYIEGTFHLFDWLDFVFSILPNLKFQANLQGEW